jgi:hypothetical protein
MASAALLAREEVRDTQRRVEIRQRLHEFFADGLEGLEACVKASLPTLAALTHAVFALQREVTQALPEGLVEEAYRALGEQRTAACWRCEQTVSAGGPQERTVTTWVGAI